MEKMFARCEITLGQGLFGGGENLPVVWLAQIVFFHGGNLSRITAGREGENQQYRSAGENDPGHQGFAASPGNSQIRTGGQRPAVTAGSVPSDQTRFGPEFKHLDTMAT